MPNPIDVSTHGPLSHTEAMRLQGVELDRAIGVLRSLTADEWHTPTDCPEWDVRRMYLHVLGACEAGASFKENVHQMVGAMQHRRANGGPLEAALSGIQVRERAALTPEQLVERLSAVAPRTVAQRTKMPSLVRRLSMKVDGPVVERWALGYLIDTIYLRDLWMHRVDLAMATRRPVELTADHDRIIVADVVAEWFRRHRTAFALTLSGPAGGDYFAPGPDRTAEPLELDAVEFCRVLAGRCPAPDGLLETVVPF